MANRRFASTVFLIALSCLLAACSDGPSTPAGVSARAGDWLSFGNGPTNDRVGAGAAPAGQQAWSYSEGNKIYSSPIVVDGMVIFGGLDGAVVALDAGTGTLRWRMTTGNGVYNAPAFDAGRVFVGSSDGYLYALNAATGAVDWRYLAGNASNAPQVRVAPLVAAGVVYAGSAELANNGVIGHVFALDENTGHLIWRQTQPAGVLASPTLAGSTLVVALDNGQVVAYSTGGVEEWTANLATTVHGKTVGFTATPCFLGLALYAINDTGTVFSIDASNGHVLWSRLLAGGVIGSPACTDTAIYAADAGDVVWALDPSAGHIVWRAHAPAAFSSSPTVVGGLVLVAAENGELYAVDATTGKPSWTVNLGAKVFFSSPTVAHGVAYIGTTAGTVLAIR